MEKDESKTSDEEETQESMEEEPMEGEEKEETEEAEETEEVEGLEEAEEAEELELEEEIVEERIYTVPLREAWRTPRQKRTPRAVRILRRFIERHMKPESIVITNEVNERLWRRGIEKPPRKVRIRALRDKEGRVTVRLAEGD